MQPIFQLATNESIDQLLGLMIEFYAHEHLTFDPQVARSSLELIVANNFYGQVHLIYANDELAGYLVVTFGFSLECGGRDAFVDELYILEKSRGQGIGQQALQFAEEICRREGIGALHLEVAHRNNKAQAIYRKAGYVDHDRYLMTKWLKPQESQK